MTRVFHKFSRLALVAALAGVTIPQLASAGDRGGNNFSKSMKSGGGNQFRSMNGGNSSIGKFQKVGNSSSQISRNVLKTPKVSNFKPLNANLNQQVWNKPLIKTTPGQGLGGKVTMPGKFTKFPGRVISQGPLTGNGGINPFPGGKPPIVKPPKVLDPFPGGKPPVLDPFPGGKPPIVKPPFDPFPGGGKPPIVDPFPGGGGGGGKPPIDPGNGNGGGGNGGGNCPPKNDHCHNNKCPWPIFWPAYNGGYWNNYNNGYCTTPAVIVNEVPPVVINEVTPVSATVPVATGANGVDLVLEDLQYVEPATMLVGPAYRVKFRNQGLAAAGGFRVAIVASLNGTADAKSPMALVEVAGLASGQSSEVTVRLPRTAMQLAIADGKATIFTHLLVAADFDNLIGETDKANNVAIVERTQLEVAVK